MDPARNHWYIACHTEGLTSSRSATSSLSGRLTLRSQTFLRFSHQSQNESEPNMIKQLRAAAAIAILACAGAAAARAQEVTQSEKERAMQYLESTKKGVLDATKGLSDAQWNFKAGPDRWSIAQVMEHIAAAEDFIRQMDAEKVMMAPAIPGRDLKKTDDAVIAMVPDRSQKAQAPEPLVPTNRFGSPDGSVKHFVESRAKTEDFLKTTPGLRDHAIDSPMGSKLDGYEFVLLIAAHSERHTKQILEVKADPNYPKN
jgi:DinB superfamily